MKRQSTAQSAIFNSVRFFCLLCILPASSFGYGNLQFRDANSNVVNSVWDERSYNSATFPDGIPWLLNSQGTTGSTISDVTLAELSDIVSSAFATWQAVPQTKIRFTYGGLTTSMPPSGGGTNGLPPSPALDGDNVISFGSLPSGALAITYSFVLNDQYTFTSANNSFGGTDPDPDIPPGTYPSGTILDSDILLASNEAWSVTGERGKYDLQATITHEIGHFIGLSHSCVREMYSSTATLFPFAARNPEGLEQRTLSQDDIAGVGLYYPSASYATSFGTISGTVTRSGVPFFGAHVWAVKANDRSVIVGTYTASHGTYSLQGLLPGNYILRVEPICVDRSRINDIFSLSPPADSNFYIDIVNFQAQFYGGTAVESSSPAITVTAGNTTTGKDFAVLPANNPDPFEPDDTIAQATTLTPDGSRQIHHFYPKADVDYFRFNATTGTTYRIFTANIVLEHTHGSTSVVHNSDTVVTLYDADGATVLGYNTSLSSQDSRLESAILFTCQKSGQYFLKVADNTPDNDSYRPGSGSNYDIGIQTISPTEYFVSANTGSDFTGNGSQGAPWATVQHAIDTVVGTQDQPVTIKVAEGVYHENITCDIFESLLGGFDQNNWTRDPQTHASILDGGGSNPALVLADAITVDGFTIQNGTGASAVRVTATIINTTFIHNYSGNPGGALYVSGSDSFISRNSFENNVTYNNNGAMARGGAIALDDSQAYVCYNSFRSNTAGRDDPYVAGWGGAIYLSDPGLFGLTGHVIGNQFIGNSASSAGGAIAIDDAGYEVFEGNSFAGNSAQSGGAMFVYDHDSWPIVRSNVFSSCTAVDGGAIAANFALPKASANFFAGNVATNRGGAVYLVHMYSLNGQVPTFDNSVFAGNRGQLGGAIYDDNNEYCNVSGDTFMENQALLRGGGILVNGMAVTNNSTAFNDNIVSSSQGGGIYEENAYSDLSLRYNDFVNNSPGAYYDDDTATWHDTASSINSSVVNPFCTVTNNVDWDPGFKPAPSGTAASITYNAATAQSVLTVSGTPFTPNALAKLTINPNTNQFMHFYIITNTASTVTVWGDMTAVATAGSEFRVFDYHLAPSSQNIDAGSNFIAGTSDIDGDIRPVGSAVDIGADESLIVPAPTYTWTNTPVPPTPTFTFTRTNTPVTPSPTYTWTNTPVPATPTFTFTRTNTPVTPSPTYTWTNTPVPATPTFTFTRTNTPVTPSPTYTWTNTPVPATPTFTFTRTNTPVTPSPTYTWTNTPVPATPTFTFTRTNTPVTPSPTYTWTNTPVPATPTFTFTRTNTPVTPSPTYTWTNTPVPPTPTFTFTQTNTPVTPSPTYTLTNTPVTPTATNTPPPTPTTTPCTGDCNQSGDVQISEIITMVDIALGNLPISACEAGDTDGSGTIEIHEIIAAVNNALRGCS